MKGRLFSLTMFVLVLGLALAVPASAAPRPPIQSLTVAHWFPTEATTTHNWNFEARGINWQGYKPALVELGHAYSETPEIRLSLPDVVLPVNAKAYPFPQNLDLVDSGHTYNIVGNGCSLEQYVRLYDSQGKVLATVYGPGASYCIVPVQLP